MKKANPDIQAPRHFAARVLRELKLAYPDVFCALVHANPFQLLAATILSAQCTDKKVNEVTPSLFQRFPDAKALALAEPEEVERLIHATGFFRVKDHAGEVPQDLQALTELPGVGRKTANVVLGTAFGIASGVVVDTHVKRLSFRLGLTQSVNPEQIERDLVALLPKKEWVDFSHRLIAHGRTTCISRKPSCKNCALAELCPRLGITS